MIDLDEFFFGPDDFAAKRRICDDCFTEVSVTGECLCEADE